MAVKQRKHLIWIVRRGGERIFVRVGQGGQVFAEPDELAIEAVKKEVRFPGLRKFAVENALIESGLGTGVGHLIIPGQGWEFLATTFTHSFGKRGIAVADDVSKRSGLAVFLAHEKQGKKGREQDCAGSEFQALEVDEVVRSEERRVGKAR